MTTIHYSFNPPETPSLPIQGSEQRFPVNRIFCVGRNYPAHAIEMGRPHVARLPLHAHIGVAEIVSKDDDVFRRGSSGIR